MLMDDIDINNAILAYLDHVQLKIKRDPNYEPHPILKAIMLSMPLIEIKEDGNHMSISGNGNEEKGIEPTEIYSVITSKKGDTYEILDIVDIKTGKSLDIYDALLIIELSLKLEKIDKDEVSDDELREMFDETMRDVGFCFVTPKNFKKARDYFKNQLQERKISIPREYNFIGGLTQIKEETQWVDYPPNIRCLITTIWAAQDEKYGISLRSENISKKKVIPLFKTIFTGRFKELIIRNLNNKFQKEKNDD